MQIDAYLRQIEGYQPLPDATVRALCRTSHDGSPDASGARSDVIDHNLLLVVSIARKYTKYGIPLDDAIQEGNAGLCVAADRYDPDRETRFTTYAGHWIKSGIRRWLMEHPSNVRVPGRVRRLAVAFNRTTAALAIAGTPPTFEATAAAMGYNVEGTYGDRRRTILLDAIRAMRRPGRDDALEAVGFSAPPEENPDEEINLDAYVACLGWPGATIIRMRYGLDGPAMTLRQVGTAMRYTGERIRQLERIALADLRIMTGSAI